MKHLKLCIIVVLFSLAGGMGMTASVLANNCRQVIAQLEERRTTTDCTSPNNFCAIGTIFGNFGLIGTTFFTVDSASPGPASSPGSGTYSGIFEIRTNRGTIKLRETGVSKGRPGNPAGGISSSFAEVLEGTGRYSGATGDVWFRIRNVNGVFDVWMSGEICLPD